MSETTTATNTTTTTETETETIACEACGEHYDEGESCDTCWHCSGCGESHTEDTARCEGCDEHPRRGATCVDYCDNNHGCFYCEGCEMRHTDRYNSQCENCSGCTETHDCSYCGSCCEYTSDSVCSDCDRCEGCECECTRTNIRFVENPLRFWGAKTTPTFPWKRHVACEIELAEGGGSAVDRVVAKWSASVRTDASVNDGCEINTAPAFGAEFEAQLRELGTAMDATGCDTDHRCGGHIHVDARDLSYSARARMSLAWGLLEETFYSFIPSDRRRNRYCTPRAGQIMEVFTGWERDFTASVWKERFLLLAVNKTGEVPMPYNATDGGGHATEKDLAVETRKYNRAIKCGRPYVSKRTKSAKVTTRRERGTGEAIGGDRYFGFNVRAMFSHGTIEFRFPNGSASGDYFTRWGAILAAFVSWAKDCKHTDLLTLGCMTESQQRDWLLALLPTEDQREWFRREYNEYK